VREEGKRAKISEPLQAPRLATLLADWEALESSRQP